MDSQRHIDRHLFRKQLMHMFCNKLFRPSNYGTLEGIECMSNLLYLTYNILSNNHKNCFLIIFEDAFSNEDLKSQNILCTDSLVLQNNTYIKNRSFCMYLKLNPNTKQNRRLGRKLH